MTTKTKFSNLRTTRLGKAGEDLAEKHFTAKGFHCYRPKKGKRHPFDIVLISPELEVVLCEIKCYPKRWAYSDTGVDAADWKIYRKTFQTNSNPLWIVFVDIQERKMYFFEMNSELIGAARESDGKVYFPLYLAKPLIREIGDESLSKLREAARAL